MRQKALLTSEETDILKSLLGKPINGLVAEIYGYGQFDGLHLLSEGEVLLFSGDEVSTPTATYATNEVGRISVRRSNMEQAQRVEDYRALRVGYFGEIQGIWRMHTIISFHYSRREKSRTTASGEVRPAGEIYAAGPVLHHPTQVTQDTEEWVDTDLGIVLTTDSHSLLVYNEDANSIYLGVRLDYYPEELPLMMRDTTELVPLAST